MYTHRITGDWSSEAPVAAKTYDLYTLYTTRRINRFKPYYPVPVPELIVKWRIA